MPTQVHSRFRCDEVTHSKWGDCVYRKVKMSATQKADFAKATPSGSLEFTVSNESVFPVFEPGKEYDLLMTEHVEPEIRKTLPAEVTNS